jgi:hypothetical protein
MLLVVSVIGAEGLVAMHRIVAGIDVQDDLRRHGAAGADKEIDQVVVEDLDAAGLGGADLQQHGPLLHGQLGLAAREGILEARQGRRAGQGIVGVGGNVGQNLKERVGAQLLGIIEVRVAGQDLIDGLREQRLGRVFDQPGRARVGESLGQVGDDAQRFLQGADGEETGIGDDAATVESSVQLLRADVPEGKVGFPFDDHDREPPHDAKLLVTHSLDSARGSLFKDSVHLSG